MKEIDPTHLRKMSVSKGAEVRPWPPHWCDPGSACRSSPAWLPPGLGAFGRPSICSRSTDWLRGCSGWPEKTCQLPPGHAWEAGTHTHSIETGFNDLSLWVSLCGWAWLFGSDPSWKQKEPNVLWRTARRSRTAGSSGRIISSACW